jgi:hypothetical protein
VRERIRSPNKIKEEFLRKVGMWIGKCERKGWIVKSLFLPEVVD